MKFADLFKSTMTTSADIKAAIARVQAGERTALSQLESLTAARTKALIEDDDASLDRIERQVALAQRDVDRAALALSELRRQLASAEAAERQAELDALHGRGLAAQRRGVALIRKDYLKAALQVKRIAAELEAIDKEVVAVNEGLIKAGDPRRIAPVDNVARPQRDGISFHQAPIYTGLMLPSAEDGMRWLMPAVNAFGEDLHPSEVVER